MAIVVVVVIFEVVVVDFALVLVVNLVFKVLMFFDLRLLLMVLEFASVVVGCVQTPFLSKNQLS